MSNTQTSTRSLWRHANFLRLWTAETSSLMGTQVTVIAIPTLAILLLHADAFSVGILTSLQWISFLFVGPIVGVIVDRLPKRPIMIISDVGRLITLSTIPIVFALGIRTMLQLYLVSFIVSTFTVFFDVAYLSYLPTLVERSALVEGNEKLAAGEAASQILGPALGGVLIQWVGSATAIIANAGTFLISALLLFSIKPASKEVLPVSTSTKGNNAHALREIQEGFSTVWKHPVLRGVALANTITGLGAAIVESAIFIFAYQTLHQSPGLVGTAMAIGNIGFILGVFINSKVTHKLGVGPTLMISCVIGSLSFFLIPLSIFGLPLVIITIWRVLYGLHIPTYDINQLSLRQSVTPDHLQGRMNATVRTLSFGALGIGPFVGGVITTHFGVITTLLVGGAIYLLAALSFFAKPMWSIKEHIVPAFDVEEQLLTREM